MEDITKKFREILKNMPKESLSGESEEIIIITPSGEKFVTTKFIGLLANAKIYDKQNNFTYKEELSDDEGGVLVCGIKSKADLLDMFDIFNQFIMKAYIRGE